MEALGGTLSPVTGRERGEREARGREKARDPSPGERAHYRPAIASISGERRARGGRRVGGGGR